MKTTHVDEYVRATVWERRCGKTLWKDVVRRTLWERREKYVVRKSVWEVYFFWPSSFYWQIFVIKNGLHRMGALILWCLCFNFSQARWMFARTPPNEWWTVRVASTAVRASRRFRSDSRAVIVRRRSALAPVRVSFLMMLKHVWLEPLVGNWFFKMGFQFTCLFVSPSFVWVSKRRKKTNRYIYRYIDK